MADRYSEEHRSKYGTGPPRTAGSTQLPDRSRRSSRPRGDTTRPSVDTRDVRPRNDSETDTRDRRDRREPSRNRTYGDSQYLHSSLRGRDDRTDMITQSGRQKSARSLSDERRYAEAKRYAEATTNQRRNSRGPAGTALRQSWIETEGRGGSRDRRPATGAQTGERGRERSRSRPPGRERESSRPRASSRPRVVSRPSSRPPPRRRETSRARATDGHSRSRSRNRASRAEEKRTVCHLLTYSVIDLTITEDGKSRKTKKARTRGR
jgi:hypothetical protein